MKTKYAHLLVKYLDEIYTQYKHVSVKLESYWGTELCHQYLRYLLVNDRNDDREGFDFKIYVLIVSLYIIHAKEFGNFDDPVQLDDLNFDINTIHIEEL